MKTRSLRLTAVLTGMMLAGQALFALGAGTSNADFLKIGVGSRPMAMAGAFAAVADDSNAAFWNPAGVALVDKWSFTLMHLMWFMNTNYEYASIVAPIDNLTGVGLSVNYFWVPSFNSTEDISGIFLDGDAPASSDMAVTLSIARNLGNLYTTDFTIGNISLGINFTYIRREILGKELDPLYNVDAGIIASLTDLMKVGLNLQNMGNSLGEDPSPFNVCLGTSLDMPVSKEFGVLAAIDINKPFDLTNPEYINWFFNMGLELKFMDILFLRGGYKFGNEDDSFTAGAGIGFPEIGSIDYAFVPHAELGITHRISVSAMFGSSVPRPVVGAPRPPANVKAMAGDKVVSLGWEPNPESNIAGYNIYLRKKGENAFAKLNDKPVMDESKFNAVLNNDVEYEFAVTAINNRSLESTRSDLISATPKKYVVKKPAKITGVNAYSEGANIIVKWRASTEDFVAGYNLYYKKQDETKYKRLNRQLLRESQATLAGLASGVKYQFVVTASGKDGTESDYSVPVASKIEEDRY